MSKNRIVVDYGDTEDLFLLAAYDTQSGREIDYEELKNIGFPIVKRYDGIDDISKLKKLKEDNKEGFVIRFKSGFRVKVKFDEYVRLHRIITQVSTKTVWEYLSQDKSFDELLERVPDEFYGWVRSVKETLEKEFNDIKDYNEWLFYSIVDRKRFAEIAKEQPNSNLLFTRLNSYSKKALHDQIWKMIKPKYSRPFKNTEE